MLRNLDVATGQPKTKRLVHPDKMTKEEKEAYSSDELRLLVKQFEDDTDLQINRGIRNKERELLHEMVIESATKKGNK